jgi:hypothetical protein
MALKELANHHRVILRFADVVMRLGCTQNILNRQHTSGGQVFTEATNTSLAPLNLGQLLDERFTTCPEIPAFGCSVLQFTLSDSQTSRTLGVWEGQTISVVYESVVPNCRIVAA